VETIRDVARTAIRIRYVLVFIIEARVDDLAYTVRRWLKLFVWERDC